MELKRSKLFTVEDEKNKSAKKSPLNNSMSVTRSLDAPIERPSQMLTFNEELSDLDDSDPYGRQDSRVVH